MRYEIELLEKQLENLKDQSDLQFFIYECIKQMGEFNKVLHEIFKPSYASIFKLDSDLSLSCNDGAEINGDEGQDKCRLIVDSITKLFLLPEQHPKRTYRLPGVAVVNNETFELISMVNKVKLMVEEAMTQSEILHPRMRGDFIKKLNTQGVVSLKEFYRKVVLVPFAVDTISFTWGNKVPQIEKYSKPQLLRELEDLLEGAEENRKFGLKSDIAIVKKYPDSAIFRTTREVPPHPRVNFKLKNPEYVESKSGLRLTDVFQRHGHLPIILNDESNAVGSFHINNLKSSSETRQREGRPNVMSNYKKVNILKGNLELMVSY